MKKELITSKKTSSDRIYVKFGLEYTQELICTESFYASYPSFISLTGFNKIISEIINTYYCEERKIVIKTVFADKDYVSVMINGNYALNYSVRDSCLLPPSFVLKARGIKKRHFKLCVKRYEKGCSAYLDTLRFASGGVRVELRTRSEDTVTLKIAT